MNDGIVSRNLSWKEMVERSWGKEYKKPDIAYEFTGHRFFDRGTALAGDGITSGSLYADNYSDNYA